MVLAGSSQLPASATLRCRPVDAPAGRRCTRSAPAFVLAALCLAPEAGLAGPGSPFGPDDTGCAPDTRDHLRCESALASALSTLGVQTTRCERQQVDNAFRILHPRLGSPPPRFDKGGCVRSRAKAPFDQALGELDGAGICPPAALVNARALGSALVAGASTPGSMDALNEVIYCDPASGTRIDSVDGGSSGGGYVPSTRRTLRCSDGVGKHLARLVRGVTGCHVRFARAAFNDRPVAAHRAAGQGGVRGLVFDEDACEGRARARFTRAARELVVRAMCPPCLDLAAQTALADADVAKADRENGRIFVCAESATPATTTSTTTTSTTRPPPTTTRPVTTTTTPPSSTTSSTTSTTQQHTTTTRTTTTTAPSSTTSSTTSTTQQPTTTTTTTTLASGTTTTSTLPAVFVIVMENQNWSAIRGNASAPYINDALLPIASHAEEYYNPPGNHPSEPNYLWLEAGTSFGVADDNSPFFNHQTTTRHLVSLLDAAGVSWKAYQEDISGTVCPVIDFGALYVTPHNPFVFFDDVTGSRNPADPYCIAHVRPYSELATDLGNDTVARYNFITPNVCNDMHVACAPLSDDVKQGDAWLSTEVPKILASHAYANKGVLFVTWDEAASGDGPIGMIVLSPTAKGAGYSNRIHYTHSSTLRTVEEIFGVSPLLNDAANATDLSDLFASFP